MTEKIEKTNKVVKDQKRAKDNAVTFYNEEEPGVRAVIVHLDIADAVGCGLREETRSVEADVAEITGLALAIELDIVETYIVSVRKVSPATFMGSGKVSELKSIVHNNDVELIITNTQLSPGQQRNLENTWDCKVLDRTGLILEIFGRRAQTREGRLQVDLAHLGYQKSRLVRSWTHLERQRGASGTVGGPGETQKESDRRDLQQRMKKLERQLEKVKKTRGLHRKSRQKVPYPVVALVGYTNAGKSTLFNQMTTGGVLADDMLFATLDPTMRQLQLPHGRRVILSDTVGFIANLPTQLVAAFRATLEEVLSADLIVHVRDIAHTDSEIQRMDVLNVLQELGVNEKKRQSMLEVWNKADLLSDEDMTHHQNSAERFDKTTVVSALKGTGISTLLNSIEDCLSASDDVLTISISVTRGADLAWIYQNGDVLENSESSDGLSMLLSVRFAPTRIEVARQRFAEDIKELEAA